MWAETPKASPDLKQEEAQKLDLNQLIEQSLANHWLNKVEWFEMMNRFKEWKEKIIEDTKNELKSFLDGLKNGEWWWLRQAFDNYEKATPEEESKPPRETEAEIQERVKREAEAKLQAEREGKKQAKIEEAKTKALDAIEKSDDKKEEVIDKIDKIELKKEDLSKLGKEANFDKWFDEFDDIFTSKEDIKVKFDDVEINWWKINFSFDDTLLNEDYNKNSHVELKDCLKDDWKGNFIFDEGMFKKQVIEKAIPDAIKKMPKEEEKKQEQKK